MTKHRAGVLARRLFVVAAGIFALAGCTSLQPQANGPNGCVGPPDFCTPYFGS